MKIPFLLSIMFTLAGAAEPAVTRPSVPAQAETDPGCTLRIHVDGLRNQTGVEARQFSNRPTAGQRT